MQHGLVEPCNIREQANAHRMPFGQVKRDIAAVVDPGTLDSRAVVARDQRLCHRARHGRHGRDKALGAAMARIPHRPRDIAPQRALRAHRRFQLGNLGHELVQHGREPPPGIVMRSAHLRRVALRVSDDVDGAMLKMQPPAGEHTRSRPHGAATRAGAADRAARGSSPAGLATFGRWGRHRDARPLHAAPAPVAAHIPCARRGHENHRHAC